MRLRLLSTILLAIVGAQGCSRKECRPFKNAVPQGFHYVGSFSEQAWPIPEHTDQKADFPAMIEKGKVYVLHTSEPMTIEEAALKRLPKWLDSAGATVLYAPRDWGDFAIPSNGAPMFQIHFKVGNCTCRLSNHVDPALGWSRSKWPDGSREDFVLRIE